MMRTEHQCARGHQCHDLHSQTLRSGLRSAALRGMKKRACVQQIPPDCADCACRCNMPVAGSNDCLMQTAIGTEAHHHYHQTGRHDLIRGLH